MTAILVADDDMDIRDLVAFKLEQAGYDVVAVDDGLAALTDARPQNPPDLVVLDVMMPGMSGIDVCRQLRAGRRAPRRCRSSCSPRGPRRATSRSASGAGADDYIDQTLQPRELVSRVEAVLARMRT